MESQVSAIEKLELTARDIYNCLVEGKSISLLLGESDANFLFNHINVIKSRETVLRRDLGMDFERKILRMDIGLIGNGNSHTFRFEEPKPNKKYIVYRIADLPKEEQS